MKNICDILIMTASFGNGHHSATKALTEHIEGMFPDLTVETADLFEIASPKLKEYFTETYNLLTKTKFPLYNGFYNLRNTRENVIDDIALKLYYKKVDERLQMYNPKMIISVFPTCANFAGHYKHHYNPDLKMVTVITDVVGNWEWIHQDTDMYFAPSEDVKEQLIHKGVGLDRIVVTGVPVKKAFEKKLNSSSERKNVLIMGSSMGKMKFSQEMLNILGKMPYDFTIVAGKNESLITTLALSDKPDNIKILSFTKEIPRLMQESDLIVTKPGGATIFEAIETELPMLIKSSGVGQETYNEAFICKYGLGDSFDKNNELIEKIDYYLSDETTIECIANNINRFKASLNKNEAYRQLVNMIYKKPVNARL